MMVYFRPLCMFLRVELGSYALVGQSAPHY